MMKTYRPRTGALDRGCNQILLSGFGLKGINLEVSGAAVASTCGNETEKQDTSKN